MKPRTSGSWNCPVQIGVGTLTGPSYSTCAGACALAPPTPAPPTADPAARRRSLAANAKGRRARLCWLHAADFWTRVFVMFLLRIGIYQLSKMCSVGQKRLRLEHVLSASCSSCQTRGGEGGEEAS